MMRSNFIGLFLLLKFYNRKVIKRSYAAKKSMIERTSHWTDWFKEWMFYQYGLVYMGARMLNNVSASMM